MTTYSKWSIRISLIYLLVGFSIGGLMLADKGFRLYPGVVRFLPLHMEYLMFGWFIHLIFGTAYWMFPRFTPGKSAMDRPRGFVRAAWIALFCLNIGLVIFTLSYVVSATYLVRAAGRSFELLAVLFFLVNLWPRVKPVSNP